MSTVSQASPRYELIRSCRPDFWLIVDNQNNRRATGPWLIDKAEEYLALLEKQEARKEAERAAKQAEAKPAKPLFPVTKESTRVSEPCWTCGKLITPRPDSESNYCKSCRRSAAEAEANSLLGTVKDLRHGTGVFAVLSVGERAEQLVQLLDVQSLDASTLIELGAQVAESIATRLGSVWATPPAAVRQMSVTELASEEPIYDARGYRPSAAERDEHESHFELGDNDVPPEFDEAFGAVLRIPIQSEPDYRPAA
jgi:hypothetical protein